MNKLIIFMLFASCMLIAGVGQFTYATTTDHETSWLTADQIDVEKAGKTDYATFIFSVATCGNAPEIKALFTNWVAVNVVLAKISVRKFIAYKLARDSPISFGFI